MNERSPSALDAIGLDAVRREEFAALPEPRIPGRVTRVDRGMATVATETGDARIDLAVGVDLAVGDWVALDESGSLREIMERRSSITRLVGHRRDVLQVVAANVDVVLLVRPLDVAVSPARIQSLLALTYDTGATPVVLLTKADLADDAEEVALELVSTAPGTEVVTVSTVTGEGVERVRELIVDRTVVLVGESGAGKSTLTNLLVGAEVLAVGETRGDGQGRHTTTHRELVALPGGGAIIDTPGIREVVAALDADSIDAAFDDVIEAAAACRFNDCSHTGEPGCAVAEAVASGALPASRLEAYAAAQREAAFHERRVDPAAQAALKAQYRAMTRRRRKETW